VKAEPVGRVLVGQGKTVVVQPEPLDDYVAPWGSIISPGTERRQILEKGVGSGLGYMNLVGAPATGFKIIPVPHGSDARVEAGESLEIPRPVQAHIAVAARFALMFAASISKQAGAIWGGAADVTIVGAGPVAFGAALELRRRGVNSVEVLARSGAAWELDGVDFKRSIDGTRDVIVDATGDPSWALAHVSNGGVVALLGTPDVRAAATIGLLDTHRRGVGVLGLHELALWNRMRYQSLYLDLVRWIGDNFTSAIHANYSEISPDEYASWIRRPAHSRCPFGVIRW
jgi:threonine dehydrogenase-like Zn-dependent dehydrogenase